MTRALGHWDYPYRLGNIGNTPEILPGLVKNSSQGDKTKFKRKESWHSI
jgi:hypothetical protein